MFAAPSALVRHRLVVAGACSLVLLAVPVQAQLPSAASTQGAQDATSIRPFRIGVPQADLDDLRRRVLATRWPERENVADGSQGLNALPQFITTIDGLDIQFIHVRSREKNAMPLLMTHGWPGSPLERVKVIAPLTDPVAHGGKAEDAFDLVMPTYPGYGFSGKPSGTGWGPITWPVRGTR